MKSLCELCGRTARLFCESDQAGLCFDCDRKIHSANFLVAKHSRTLLCHTCQSPTPWTTSGLNLCRAASICVNCLGVREICRRRNSIDVVEENCVNHDEMFMEGDGETDDYSGEFRDRDEDEEGENQVVPWPSESPPPTATATATASSTNEELSSSRSASNFTNSAVKRRRVESDDSASSTPARTIKVNRSHRGKVVNLA